MTCINGCRQRSTLFRLVFRLFLGFSQRHRLFERLAHFVQALLFNVMHALGAFSTEVNQFVVLAHGVSTSLERITTATSPAGLRQ